MHLNGTLFAAAYGNMIEELEILGNMLKIEVYQGEPYWFCGCLCAICDVV